MGSPEKPFSCLETGCGASFTNEDRLAVHARKHDMVLQLGPKEGAFVADQTPTPTRFIRNCEEVGLFQDLQNVNPFDETFRIAMEARSNNDNHLNPENNLTITNPDDTLHTPRIFPHLTDDGSTGLYSANTDRTNLTVQRSSSDESTNHLTVVRCISSSVEDNLSSVGLQDNEHLDKSDRKVTVLVEKKLKKKIGVSSKLKLTRQESIDVPDELSSNNIREYSDSHQNKPFIDKNQMTANNTINNCGLKSIHDDRNRVLQIPVISISEMPKSDEVIHNSKQTILEDDDNKCSNRNKQLCLGQNNMTQNLNTPKADQKKYLDIKSSLKSNFSKLISQKSMEIALADLTNDTHSKMDLNNISIEDLSEPHTVIKDGYSQNDTFERRKRILSFKRKSSEKSLSTEVEKVRKSVSFEHTSMRKDDSSIIPIIESVGGNSLSEDADQGYELMLKWPNGKKIYLKEVHRDEDLINASKKMKTSSNSCINNDTSKSIDLENDKAKINLKQKLKDMIESNANKAANNNLINNQLILNPMPVPNVILPENYVIVPQVIPNPHVPVVTNNLQFVSLVSPSKLQQHPYILSKPIPETQIINPMERITSRPVIRKVLNGKVSDGSIGTSLKLSDLSNAKRNDSRKPVAIGMNIVSANEYDAKAETLAGSVKSTEKNSYSNKSCSDSANTPKKIASNTTDKSDENKKLEIQKRNRVAVFRYRMKEKRKHEKLQEKNVLLEKQNQELVQKLDIALQEIKRLRDSLTYYTMNAESNITEVITSHVNQEYRSVIFMNNANNNMCDPSRSSNDNLSCNVNVSNRHNVFNHIVKDTSYSNSCQLSAKSVKDISKHVSTIQHTPTIVSPPLTNLDINDSLNNLSTSDHSKNSPLIIHTANVNID